MKRVTILALHLGYGGVENSIASLSNIFAEEYDVEIISVYKLYDEPAFHIDKKVKITYLLDKTLSPNKDEIKIAIKSKNPFRIIKEGLKSIKILRLKKSRMIQAIQNIESGIVISTRIEHNKLLSKYRKKTFFTIAQEHTYHEDGSKYINDVVKSCKSIDYFMPVSKQQTKLYTKYFKGTSTRCKFIPHSLDFIPDKVASLKEHNIISIGRLSKEKGFLDLIDIFNLVLEKRPDCKLNIIGDGGERNFIEQKIKDYNIEKNVILHGYRSKQYISNILMKSSLYVMTSYEESFGLVLIESQSFGVPCIAFDNAKGACEIIENDVNGYLISNRNKKEMAEKIIKLMDDYKLRRNMGIKSRKNSLIYSKENISKQWFEFLNNKI